MSNRELHPEHGHKITIKVKCRDCVHFKKTPYYGTKVCSDLAIEAFAHPCKAFAIDVDGVHDCSSYSPKYRPSRGPEWPVVEWHSRHRSSWSTRGLFATSYTLLV
jgi:hypothetical protein